MFSDDFAVCGRCGQVFDAGDPPAPTPAEARCPDCEREADGMPQ